MSFVVLLYSSSASLCMRNLEVYCALTIYFIVYASLLGGRIYRIVGCAELPAPHRSYHNAFPFFRSPGQYTIS
jgi:hypothetical protein